jgi:hypothetical protein
MAEAVQQIDRPLDEVMLAMDVVDTLRHREHLVERELSEEQRDAKLIERLRDIYRKQGIDVPDSILLEGVAALKEDRFKYDPPRVGLSVKLANLYITRGRWGKYVLIAIGLLIAAIIAWYFFVERPRQQQVEYDRLELAEFLPAQLKMNRDLALAEAKTEEGRNLANAFYQAGMKAVAAGDAPTARTSADGLYQLLTKLRSEYTLTVISRQGESSGVWRIPDVNPDARNYYLIVEALDPNGKPLTLPVKSEEDGKTYNVDKFGIRVSSAIFDQIRSDKSDDGIIQNNRVGVKRRGYLKPEFLISIEGGMITRW